MHITVVDVNEYAPQFLQPAYVSTVDEGRLYEEVVRVEASDRDCTPKFGDVCKYEILTADQRSSSTMKERYATPSRWITSDLIITS